MENCRGKDIKTIFKAIAWLAYLFFQSANINLATLTTLQNRINRDTRVRVGTDS
jgi:hypothetical protein